VASYRVFIKSSAAKEIEAAGQKKDRRRIVEGIESLAHDPLRQGCEKLSVAWEPGLVTDSLVDLQAKGKERERLSALKAVRTCTIG
jgi:hypothetical protein